MLKTGISKMATKGNMFMNCMITVNAIRVRPILSLTKQLIDKVVAKNNFVIFFKFIDKYQRESKLNIETSD